MTIFEISFRFLFSHHRPKYMGILVLSKNCYSNSKRSISFKVINLQTQREQKSRQEQEISKYFFEDGKQRVVIMTDTAEKRTVKGKCLQKRSQ